MARGPGAGYRDAHEPVPNPQRRRHAGVPMTALHALWSARSWRATLDALVGLPLATAAVVVVAGLVVVWTAAVWSLLDGPTGAWVLAVVYVVVAVAGPVALP
jgi:hypothetical protein